MGDISWQMEGPGQAERTVSEHVSSTLTETLANAAAQAKARNYSDFLIVDADSHHYENTSEPWQKICKYIENDVVRQRVEASLRTGSTRAPTNMVRSPLGDRQVGGRIKRFGLDPSERRADETADITAANRAMDAMGIDYSLLFPTDLLNIGVLPEIDVQVALNWAYARWLTEEVLPAQPRLRTMVSLPFNDAQACLRMVETFGGREGVVGFVVGSAFHTPVHSRAYMPVYSAIQSQGLPIAFHSTYNWHDRLTEQFNKFLSAHGIGRTLYNMVHLTNWIINGIPERFPELKSVWIESGVTYLPFLMQRLDAEYMMRSSEAPLLKGLPSEYIRQCYFTPQPLERTVHDEALEQAFDMINAETQVLYASDYPHWDFDLPSTIFDLPFLSQDAKRNILGENARKLFNL